MADKQDKVKVKRTKYQTAEEIEVHRTQLKNAPYNPRKIDDAARKKLKKNIQKVGLLGGVVWNRLTGNIVSGHQRVSILDSLEKTCDYMIRVTPVEMDDKTEKEQNIFFNNADAQGDFEVEALEQMMRDSGLDVENMGFDLSDQINMFGLESLGTEDAIQAAEALKASRDFFDKQKKSNASRDMDNFFLVVVFKNHESRLAFANRLGFLDDRYIDGQRLFDLFDGFGGEAEA